MKAYTLLVFLLSFVGFIIGQSNYSKNIDIDGYSDSGNSINEIASGYLLTATSLCNNNLSECFSIIKTDNNGNVDQFVQYQNFPWWITAGTANGNIGVALNNDDYGYFTGTIEYSNQNYDVFLMKANEEGDSLWMKTFGSMMEEANKTIIYKTDTSLLLFNEAISPQNDIAVWLFEVDLDGNMIWEDYYGEEFEDIFSQDIVQLTNGDIVFSYLSCDDPISCGPYSMTVTRISAQEEELWTSRFASYDGLLSSNPHSNLVALDNGGFLVTYMRDNLLGFYKRPPIMVWLDSTGNVTDQYDFSDFTELHILDLIKTSDGTIVGAGQIDLLDFDLGYGGWIFGFSQDGQKLWERYIVDLNFPDMRSWFSGVIQTDDGGFALTGNILAPTGYDVWLVKLDSMGCLWPDCEGELQVLASGQETLITGAAGWKLFPNPVGRDYLYIEKPSGYEPDAGSKILVFDSFGRIVKSQDFESRLDVSDLEGGMYFLSIESAQGANRVIGKFVVR